MPYDINFNYYSTQDFHNNQEITDCLFENIFSFLNCNIRSLSANIDNLNTLLHELLYPLTLIGLTETKLNTSQDSITNIDLRGYQFLFQPSFSNAEGAGFFIQDKHTFSVRPDLSITESGFEAL